MNMTVNTKRKLFVLCSMLLIVILLLGIAVIPQLCFVIIIIAEIITVIYLLCGLSESIIKEE